MKIILSTVFLAMVGCAGQSKIVVNKPQCSWVDLQGFAVCRCVVHIDHAVVGIVSIDTMRDEVKCPNDYVVVKESEIPDSVKR